MSYWHLAQLNVGRLVAPLDDPVVAGFVEALDPINALADAAPGFVWRLQSDSGNATDIQTTADPLFIVNMSVWTDLDALADFVYSSAHREIMVQRRTWFERLSDSHLVLWWVPAGHEPTTAEALERLEVLRRDGPTPAAFTFRQPFAPPDVEVIDAAERAGDDRWICRA